MSNFSTIAKLHVTALAALLLTFAALSPVRAASLNDDYLQLSVPSPSQAASFFQSVMGCTPLAPVQPDSSSALLECAHNSVVELRQATSQNKPLQTPVRFAVADAASMQSVLHDSQLRVLGPARSHGDHSTSVDVVTPWGQTIELVGPAADMSSKATRLAVN